MSAPQTPVAECLNGYIQWSFMGQALMVSNNFNFMQYFSLFAEYPKSLKINLGHISKLLRRSKLDSKCHSIPPLYLQVALECKDFHLL